MKRPSVSVVIPTYNAEEFIQKCLNSVVAQNYEKYEIIVVDDCSKDQTISIIKSLQIKKLKVFKTKKNSGGPAAPRNLGIAKAKGKYVAFLDQDDVWQKNKLQACMAKIADQYDFCYHQLKYSNNKILKNHNIDISHKPYSILLKKGPIPTTSGIICSKKILKKVKGFCESKNLIAGEDYDCWIKIAKAGGKFIFIKKPLGVYGKSYKNLTCPAKSMKVIKYLKEKYFKNDNNIPFWLHKSFIKNIFLTKGFKCCIYYIYKNLRHIFKSFCCA